MGVVEAMNVFKSDGRYRHFREGYSYIVDFHWSGWADRLLFNQLVNQLYALHGPQKEKIDAYRIKYNEHYRVENNSRRACRRIYLRNESSISVALLKI